MVNLNRSLKSKYIQTSLLIFLLLFTLRISADFQTLTSDFVIPHNILRIYSTIMLPRTGEVLLATDSSLLLLNLSRGLIYEIPIKDIYDLELFNDDIVVGVGKTYGKAYLLLLNRNMSVTSIKYSVNSTLYDSVVRNNTILSGGYILINSTYKAMITYSNRSGILTYIAECPSACYVRKLLITQRGEVILVGSLFLRGQNYRWSYDVFHSLLNKTSLIGIYVSLDGNDYVVSSFLINNTIYTVVNSDISGLHILTTNYENFNTSLYRILVDGRRVDGVNAVYYEDSILVIAKDLTGNSYAVLLNMSSGMHTAFSLGSMPADISMVNDRLMFLRSTTGSNLIIRNFNEVVEYLRKFDSKHVSLVNVDVFPSTLRLALNIYELSYEVSTHTVSPSTINIVTTTPTEGRINTSTSYFNEPLYALKSGEVIWSRVLFIIVGIILIVSSIMLKYLIRIKS